MNVVFNPYYDIHMLRGMTIDLQALLRIDGETVAAYRTRFPNVNISFIPNFNNVGGQAPTHAGFNIVVQTVTGRVILLPARPPIEKRNFLMEVNVINAADTGSSMVRIHVHNSIEQLWLTPGILRLQKLPANYRFSVRAKFDDDVVAEIGNISDGDKIHNHNLFAIKWGHSIPGLIDPQTGILNPFVLPFGPVSGPVIAEVRSTNGVTNYGIASGDIFIDTNITEANTTIKAELVAGSPGYAKANDVPNILFIGDGFLWDESALFDRLIDTYVTELRDGKITSPFDLLADSINFWKVFVYSMERGATTRADVSIQQLDGKTFGIPFTHQMSDFERRLGLPVSAQKTIPINQLRDELIATTDMTLPEWQQSETPAKIQKWLELSERRLPEEVDTLFGLMINNYSTPSGFDEYNLVKYNSAKRLNRSSLAPFLKTLKDVDNNPVGNLFVYGDGGIPGKDYDNFVIVSASVSGREHNITGSLFITCVDWAKKYDIDPATVANFRTKIKYSNSFKSFALQKKATLTHEISHSFGLGDEYGSPIPDSLENRFIRDLGPELNYSRHPNQQVVNGNVQARADLLSPDPTNALVGRIDPYKLKWRYPRVVKATPVKSAIVPDPQGYKVTVEKRTAKWFSPGEKVFIRKRTNYFYFLINIERQGRIEAILSVSPEGFFSPAQVPIANINAASNQVTIIDNGVSRVITFQRPGAAATFTNVAYFDVGNEPVHSVARIDSPDPETTSDTLTSSVSPELEIVSVFSIYELIIKVVNGTPLPADFLSLSVRENMVCYQPMDAPESFRTPTYKYAELISKKVLDYLTTQPFAFNAAKNPNNGNAIDEIVENKEVQNTNIPDSLVPSCSKQKHKIVGIYSAGANFHGNIYHPTARCFMRREYHEKEKSLDEFCVVCKYILVDMIAPSKHGKLNARYSDKIYPQ